MGAACEKQFQNVPKQFPYEYEKQRERIQTNSIKLQHKLFRPNSKHVTIGMIDSIIQSQMGQTKNKNDSYQSKTMSPIKSRMASTVRNQKMENNQWGARDLDLEELHATKRPFEGGDKITLGTSQKLVPREQQKNRQMLDFNFYHSLGLPEYNYQSLPEDLARDYLNLPVCQQQDRSGVKYIGQWSKDLKAAHGNGVMQSNTTKYIGQFRNGLKHFHGRQIQKFQVYEGGFENGRRKGKGFRYVPGAYEEGQFNESLVNGKIVYDDESTYEGELRNNKYHGKGKFFHRGTNVVQQGQFVNGKLHGKGCMKKEGMVVYEGQFEQDLKQGKGVYYWSRDHYYEGYYSRDKKHDKNGKLRNGNLQYHGSFQNGQMNGLIRVFQISENSKAEKNPIKFENGIRSYFDDEDMGSAIGRGSWKDRQDMEEPSIFSIDGMPAEWKETVKRKQMIDY